MCEWQADRVSSCSSAYCDNNSLGSTWQFGMKDYLAIQAAKLVEANIKVEEK